MPRTSPSQWIFGSPSADFAWLYLIGAAVLLWTVGGGMDVVPREWLLPLLIFFKSLDSGHVVTTAWRTHFHKAERTRSQMYWIAPLAVFSILGLVCWWNFEYFRATLLYFTIFHATRQFYGQIRWYEKLNGIQRPAARRFYFFFILLSFAVFHFRPGPPGLSPNVDTLHFPNASALLVSSLALAVCVAAWLLYEAAILVRERRLETNRLMAIGFPSALMIYGAVWGVSEWDVIVPLIAAHAIGYLGMVSLALERTQRHRFPGYRAWWTVLLTALIAGPLLVLFTPFPDGSLKTALIYAALSTPSFCHYLYDAVIWTRHHHEAGLVYAHSRERGAA